MVWDRQAKADAIRSRANFVGVYLSTNGMEWVATTARSLSVDKSKLLRECLLLAQEHEVELRERVEKKYHQM